jgi:hypothetical protein
MQDSEERLVNALLADGLARVRKDAPEQAIAQVEDWLGSEDAFIQQLGLRALVPIFNEGYDQNLPIFFRILTPFVRQIPGRMRADLLDALRALARRSPKETAFFLRQILETHGNSDTAWLIRQCMEDFPPEVQRGLRAAGREADLKRP